MRVHVHFLKPEEEFEFKKAEKVNEYRWVAIQNYMFMEAGVKPVNGFVAYVVNEDEWIRSLSDFSAMVGKARITENDGSEFMSQAILIKRDKNSRPYDINRRLIHEASGHIGYDNEHNISKEDDNSLRISEVFSRILDSFLIVKGSLLDKFYFGRDGSEKFYPPGTDILEGRAFAIYKRVGKKAIVQLFYSTKPKSWDNTLIDRVYEDRKLLKAIALLSARYGGNSIGNLLNNTDVLLEKADNVRDEIDKGTISEQDLMIRYLKKEFSLGESFARAYIRDLIGSSLDVLIDFKITNEIDKASELKWIYSHGNTTKPDYEHGLRFLNHYFGKIRNVMDLEKLYTKTKKAMKA